MSEFTRDFKITVKIVRDTNKTTYKDEEEFGSFEDAINYLEEASDAEEF